MRWASIVVLPALLDFNVAKTQMTHKDKSTSGHSKHVDMFWRQSNSLAVFLLLVCCEINSSHIDDEKEKLTVRMKTCL